MRWWFFLWVSINVMAQSDSLPHKIDLVGPGDSRGTYPTAHRDVLHSQVEGIPSTTHVVSSQVFTDPGAVETTYCTDDFIVPVSVFDWTITQVHVDGTFWNLPPGSSGGPPSSVNVYFFANSGQLPTPADPSQAMFFFEEIGFTDSGYGDFVIPLPTPVVLSPGRFWIGVQVVMAWADGGQWGWTEASATSSPTTPWGFESAFQHTEGTSSPACVGMWGKRITTCNQTGDSGPDYEWDFAFQLHGTAHRGSVIAVPGSGLITAENGHQTSFTVVLDQPPSSSVTLPITSLNTGEGTASPASVTFTAGTWNQPRTITVTGQDDDLSDGDQTFTIELGPCVSSDARFNGVDPADVTVTNLDDEGTGLDVSPTAGLVTRETGDTDQFNVRLRSQPSAVVTVDLASNDLTEGDVAPHTLDFSPATWNVPQTVTVIGQDDTECDGDQAYTIAVGPAYSADILYDGITGPSVQVTNLANEDLAFADPELASRLIADFDGIDGSTPDGMLDICEADWVTEIQLNAAYPPRGPIQDGQGLESFLNLETLSLAHHRLFLMPSLAQLSALTALDLRDNWLETPFLLPVNLVQVDLSQNQLTAEPDLTGLSSLTSVNLRENRLESIDLLAQHPNLGTKDGDLIDMEYNRLSLDDCPSLLSIQSNLHPNAQFHFQAQGLSASILAFWPEPPHTLLNAVDAANHDTWLIWIDLGDCP